MIRTKIFAVAAVTIGLTGQLVPDHPLTRIAAAAPQTKAPADVRARELFQKGDAAYAEGRYEEANAAFQEAYDLSGRPQLLFNLSNALERMGKYPEALDALEKYLASGKAKDKDVVQKRLANLKKRVDEQKKADERARDEEEKRAADEKVNEQAAKTADGSAPQPTGTAPSPEKRLRVLPIVLLGAGGAALATAGVFGILTLSARSDVDTGCRPSPSGRLCSSDARSALDRDKTFGLVTDVALVSGVVLGAAGVYFLIAGDKRADVKAGPAERVKAARSDVRVEARPAGAGVEVVGTF